MLCGRIQYLSWEGMYMPHRGLDLTWAEVCRQSSRTLGEGRGTWVYEEWCSRSANIREFISKCVTICQRVRINRRTQNRSSRIIDWRCTHTIRTQYMYIYGSTHVECVPMTKGVASCLTMKAHSSAQLHAPLWETLVGMPIEKFQGCHKVVTTW